MMYEKEFAIRLSKLRLKKGVSARDMSLSIGQNAGYINSIENGKSLPSMSNFFFICEYLDITPQEFFDIELEQPEKMRIVIDDLKQLTEKQFQNIASIVEDLAQKNPL